MKKRCAATAFDHALGAIIRRERKKARLSMETVGAEFSISYQQVGKYEAGSNRIPVERLYRICNLFGISVQDVLDRAMGVESEAA